MSQPDLSLDFLLQETLAMTDYLRTSAPEEVVVDKDDDYLFDLADSIISDGLPFEKLLQETFEINNSIVRESPILKETVSLASLPIGPGILYKIDNGISTFCVRGYTVENIQEAYALLEDIESSKRVILKLESHESLDHVMYFETQSIELAEAVREQIINRRFPHQEDSLCNLSDPGFSWWMDVSESKDHGRFEIFFKSHGINRAEKYLQLGPIGDGSIAALRLNQARTLLKGSFPISEYSCDEKSFIVETSKPDHLSFKSFKNIFLSGINQTELENFPDNSLGRTLYYYFHELAVVRKFWIEVKKKLS